MTKASPSAAPSDRPHRAGETERFLSGRMTYLAPLPLPVGGSRIGFGKDISELNDIWLDYGVGWPHVFGLQILLGIFIGGCLLMLVGIPLAMAAMTFNETYPFWSEFVRHVYFDLGFYLFGLGCVASILFGGYLYTHFKRRRLLPIRLNRQRREVCFVPEKPDGQGFEAPIFVPWESITAWVIEARGATQYGVQRQYGMGFGYYLKDRKRWLSVEAMAPALPLAISNWEALRAYMDYEVHSLREVQDPLDLRGPDDPPWEGRHTIRNARRQVREQRRNGEVGWIFTFFWYLWYLIQLGPLAGYLVEWEIRALRKAGPKALPEEVVAWSQPLPEEAWARPSEALLRLSAEVGRLRERDPQRPVEEIFAEVYRQHDVVA